MQVLVTKVTNFKMHRPPVLSYGSRVKVGRSWLSRGGEESLLFELANHKLLSSIFAPCG